MKTETASTAVPPATMNQSMFVTVRFGEDKSRLFNANCRIEILLHHIKQKCDCDLEDIVELSDEQGVVKNLRNHPLDYGTDHLKERETLILLKAENNHNEDPQNERLIFIPVLNTLENDTTFLESINPKMEEYMKERTAARMAGEDPEDSRNIKKLKSPKSRNKPENNKRTLSSKTSKR